MRAVHRGDVEIAVAVQDSDFALGTQACSKLIRGCPTAEWARPVSHLRSRTCTNHLGTIDDRHDVIANADVLPIQELSRKPENLGLDIWRPS